MTFSELSKGQLKAPVRPLAASTLPVFYIITAIFWGASGVFAVLFFLGVMDFTTSTKLSLYGISIWLNGWLLALIMGKNAHRDKLSMYHDCLIIWMISYAVTNMLWEIPWVIFSPFVFENLHTLNDVIAYEPYMRESVFNMYWWVLASFGSVDLRTVNHDPTFFTLEIYSFVNVLSTIYFFYLNNKQSPFRYLIPVLGSGEPIASTFIFSFTEVFADFENMPGDIWDTLLALVWTQYQYILFPLIFGYLGVKLLFDDWQHVIKQKLQSA
ncbi:MAG: hypothetical protein OXE99_04880 [Cellvibrionales bacterium]|nr:hypothetical protein [Cellvibrionales bacterium]